jgi:glycosyltransferase involved in cell wall biosynthesis
VRVAFVTVGDTGRLTGGYLYNARVLAALRERGVVVEEIVPCGASPEEQGAAAPVLGLGLNPRRFDVIVVDALARIVCAPWLDLWREERPVVAMVHELPSVAAPEDATDKEREYEEPLLRADRLISVSEHGGSIVQNRGVSVARIRVVPPGFDRLPVDNGATPPACDGTVRALCVAQWIPRKGILDLVRAWALHERPGASLELIGETDADPVYTASVRAAKADARGGYTPVFEDRTSMLAHGDQTVGPQQRLLVLPLFTGRVLCHARQLVDHRHDRTLLTPAVEIWRADDPGQRINHDNVEVMWV